MTTPTQCPVCLDEHSEGASVGRAAEGWDFRVNCPVCGRFNVKETTWEDFLDPGSPEGRKFSARCRARLAHRLRTAMESGPSGLPRLDSDMIEHFRNDGCPGPAPAQQAVNIIRFVGDHVLETGEPIERLPIYFYASIGAPNPRAAAQLAKELCERGMLTGTDASTLSGPDLLKIDLTLDGWERYESEKHGKTAGNYGFMAMEFDDDVLDTFVNNIVKPCIRSELGFGLVDMRDVARAGIIDNIMRAQIRDAAFVIVDLTHDNSGAYWEAGYAEGLGKPVVYICEKEKFDNAQTHFDTNHCTTVIWKRGEENSFRQQLVATLRRSLNLFPSAV